MTPVIVAPTVNDLVSVVPDVPIFDMNNFAMAKPDIEVAYANSQQYLIPKGYESFINLFEEIL